jgi:lipopolysaccharide export system permease protein
MFIYSLPGIVVLTFPMSMLLAALLTFGRLSASSEITAMKSGGITFYRIAAPVFIVAFIVSVFALLFNEHVVPRANEAYTNVVEYEIKGNTTPKTQEHIVLKEFSGGELSRLTYARRFDATKSLMEQLTIEEFENGQAVRMQSADRAEWQDDVWTMHDGVINELSNAGTVQRTMHFGTQVLPISQRPERIAKEQKNLDEMTIQELKYQIQALKMQHIDTGKVESELYQRYTIPFASLVFALIAVPLGLQPNRTSSSIGFGLSVVIILVYYTVMTISTTLGKGGSIPPVIGAWLPNVLGTIIGLYLLRKAAR